MNFGSTLSYSKSSYCDFIGSYLFTHTVEHEAHDWRLLKDLALIFVKSSLAGLSWLIEAISIGLHSTVGAHWQGIIEKCECLLRLVHWLILVVASTPLYLQGGQALIGLVARKQLLR